MKVQISVTLHASVECDHEQIEERGRELMAALRAEGWHVVPTATVEAIGTIEAAA